MVILNPRALLCFVGLMAAESHAQLPLGAGAPDVECSQMIVDLKKQFTCKDIIITQGSYTLEARDASTKSLNFENAVWTFTDDVVIKGKNTEVAADQAVVEIANNRLRNVKVVGQPATFEQLLEEEEQAALGRALSITYDLVLDQVILSKNAFLSQGDDQISGETITYDVQQERVIADSSGEQDGRVRILLTPTPPPESQDNPR